MTIGILEALTVLKAKVGNRFVDNVLGIYGQVSSLRYPSSLVVSFDFESIGDLRNYPLHVRRILRIDARVICNGLNREFVPYPS